MLWINWFNERKLKKAALEALEKEEREERTRLEQSVIDRFNEDCSFKVGDIVDYLGVKGVVVCIGNINPGIYRGGDGYWRFPQVLGIKIKTAFDSIFVGEKHMNLIKKV